MLQVLIWALVYGVEASFHLAHLCRNQRCDDSAYPIMDYDLDEKKCVCVGHPCWDDGGGKTHTCDSAETPHLHFQYDLNGHLACGCAPEPQYEPIFLAKKICPGQSCIDPKEPVLDWDEKQMKCICRSHPCWDNNGVVHRCSDPEFPVLKYREEEVPADHKGPKAICECAQYPPMASKHMAQLCRGRSCQDPAMPMMDFSRSEDKCFCRAHPCLDDEGMRHECTSPQARFLHFSYDKHGKLSCKCQKEPQYTPHYLAKEVCPEQHCPDPLKPVMDWDDHRMACICRSHPCWDDHGVVHSCENPLFPVLQYREEESKEGVSPVCECGVKISSREHHLGEL